MGKEYEREMAVLGLVAHLGPVVLYDDMEDLLKWTEAGTGGDTVFEKITTVAYNGSACLHMKTRTTTATEGDGIYGRRDSFQRPGQRCRFECLFRPDAAAQNGLVYFQMVIYDGTNVHSLKMAWKGVLKKWQYNNAVNTMTDVPGGGQGLGLDEFHRFMMEWDENSGRYIRFVCDGLEVDMSELSFYKTADASGQGMHVDVGMLAGVSPPGEVYFDDILVMEI